jgi:pimeloyl-ACP methyl ester carboxylesterase
VRKTLALCVHLVLLTAAFRWTHSLSGFLLNGPFPALLLDRYALRLLPWPAPVRWRRELTARLAYFLFGALFSYLLRPGIVPWWEAAYRGALFSVAAFAFDCLLVRFRRRWPRRRLRVAAVTFLALLAPVAFALHPLHTVPKRPPDALGLAFEDVRFPSADGVTLAGWVVPHPEARANVVFCHGHGRNRGHVAGLLPTLYELRLNVLAFDFRGHGDSGGHTSTFGRSEVGDLVAAAAYLRQRFPGKPLFLVGVSLGAAVSLQALSQLPEVCGVWSEGAFARLDSVIDNEFRLLPFRLRSPVVEAYRLLGRIDCGLRAERVRPVEALAGIRVPVYFCHGRCDELVPIGEGEALEAAYGGPKWHWWVDGATHYDVRQKNSSEYLRRLRSFLGDRLVDAAGSGH